MTAADRFTRLVRTKPMITAGVVLVVILLAIVAVQTWRLTRAQVESEHNALRADSLAAVADTSRATALDARDRARILGDSLHAVERLGVQLRALASDDFDRATDRTTVVRGGIAVTPGPITTVATSDSTRADSADVRHASFHVDSSQAVGSPRFVADAAVTAPPPPAAATLTLDVRLLPIVLRPRIQCGAPDPAGLRPASLAVVGPLGYDLEVLPLEVDVRACNPSFGQPRGIRVGLGAVGAVALISAVVGALLAR